MRKQLHTMFVPMLLLAVVAAAAQTPASQPAGQRNELDRVNVVRGTDDIRVELSSRGAVTPKVSTLDSPARLVVDLPETVMATAQKRIAVNASGVKDVRIGMDGQTPPTTRIVVDLDKACAYDLTPGTAGKLVLTLHAQAVAQAATAPKAVAPKTVALNTSAPQRPTIMYSSSLRIRPRQIKLLQIRLRRTQMRSSPRFERRKRRLDSRTRLPQSCSL